MVQMWDNFPMIGKVDMILKANLMTIKYVVVMIVICKVCLVINLLALFLLKNISVDISVCYVNWYCIWFTAGLLFTVWYVHYVMYCWLLQQITFFLKHTLAADSNLTNDVIIYQYLIYPNHCEGTILNLWFFGSILWLNDRPKTLSSTHKIIIAAQLVQHLNKYSFTSRNIS